MNLEAGSNIVLTKTEVSPTVSKVHISTSPKLTADSLTINNGGPTISNTGIDMNNTVISNVAEGSAPNAGVGDELHAPGALVVVRCLGGIADDEDERVPPGHREGVLLLVVVDEADELLELLQVQAGLALLLGEVDVAGRRHGRVSHPITVGPVGSGVQRCASWLVRVRMVLP